MAILVFKTNKNKQEHHFSCSSPYLLFHRVIIIKVFHGLEEKIFLTTKIVRAKSVSIAYFTHHKFTSLFSS